MKGTTQKSESLGLVTGGDAQAEASETLVGLFQESVLRHSYRTAVVCGSRRLTYVELNRAANRMADRLARRSLRPGDLAAIYLDRSVDMIVALLATLKCGAGYLPIDPGYPRARVLETLADARPAVLLTTRDLVRDLPKEIGYAVDIVDIDAGGAGEVDGALNPALKARRDDVAYVIYTSGSTGRPKGVRVAHRNVVRLLSQTQPWFHFDEKDVWTMFHSLAFDFSVWEIWGCLLTGGRLVIVPFEVSRSPEEFYLLLSDQRVTVLNQTPSAFSLLMQAAESLSRVPLSLRWVIFGGEALYTKRLKTWFKHHGEAVPRLVNMYGITETTVHVSYRPISAQDAESEEDSLIGVPIPDLRIHLLNEAGEPVADGEAGEMYIGGAGVALGYLNRPTLTANRFVLDPFSGDPAARLYRTGDLAMRRADGELVYLGRIDNQVKINGFRIELGEVESALASHPEVRQSCVVALGEAGGGQRLAAYYVTPHAEPLGASTLSGYLAQRLPVHMLPSFYVQLDALPLTGNGKIDRVALPAPANGPIASLEQPPAAFATALEERIAAAWREALGVEQVGLDDNFFDIGGTSMLLIKVRSILQGQLDRAIPVTWMFEWTTVRKLAERLDAIAAGGVGEDSAVTGAQLQADKQRSAFARMRGAKGGPQ